MNCLGSIFLKSISRKDIFLLFGILLCLCFKFVHANVPDDLLIDDSFDALLTRAINVQSDDGARQKAVKVGKALEDLFSCCGSINLGIVRSFGIDELRWIADVVPPHGDLVNSVDWSSNGKYLAIGGYPVGGDVVRVYEFDTTSATTLSWIADGGSLYPSARAYSVNWSSDGNYLAVGGKDSLGDSRVVVYKFDVTSTPTLQEIVDVNPFATFMIVFSVDWSSDGRYLAIGGSQETGIGIATCVYEFDACSSSLQLVADEEELTGGIVFSVDWSSDGRYLARGGRSSITSPAGEVRLYEFDVTATQTLKWIADAAPIPSFVFSVDWSPDGEFIVVGSISPFDPLSIYRFDVNASPTLSKVASPVPSISMEVYSVDWSSHGCYISAVAKVGPSSYWIKTYKFDPLSLTLKEASGIFIPVSTSNVSKGIKWSPNIDYLAVGIGKETKVYEVQYSQGSPRYDGKGFREIMGDIESRVDAIEII